MGRQDLKDVRFNSRLREEATACARWACSTGGCFNSRLREEATYDIFLKEGRSVGFNSRLREEATESSPSSLTCGVFQLTPP